MRNFGGLRQFLALAEIELAGGEDGNRFHPPDGARDPEIRHLGFAQGGAQLLRIDLDAAQQDERFAFGFVGHAHDRRCTRSPWSSSFRALQDFLFDRFVRHHFAADFREAREPAFDEKKTVFVEARRGRRS